mgnify:CR=1 FL=1
MTEEQYEIAKRCIDILERFEALLERGERVKCRAEQTSVIELSLLYQILDNVAAPRSTVDDSSIPEDYRLRA